MTAECPGVRLNEQPSPPARCEVRRGGIVESVHLATVCVARPDGTLVLACGDVARLIYPRSSLKPFQALAVVTTGAAKALGLTEEELAVCCASHWGTERHTALVGSVLVKAGLEESALQCGAHPPLDPRAARALEARGEQPGSIHNNCSGKHAGMLAVCAHKGWPTRDYTSPSHPLQQLNLRNLAEVCGYPAESIHIGVDGCSAPTFALPAASMALGLARLTEPERLRRSLARAAERIVEAMTRHPELIGHELSSDARIMVAGRGRMIAKGGAEACMAIADSRGHAGIFVKIDDGSPRARDPVTLEVLRRVGCLDSDEMRALKSLRQPILRNHADKTVGEIVCVL